MSSILEKVKQQQLQQENKVSSASASPVVYPMVPPPIDTKLDCPRCNDLEKRLKELEMQKVKQQKKVVILATRDLTQEEKNNFVKIVPSFIELNDAYFEKAIDEIVFSVLFIQIRDNKKLRWYELNKNWIDEHKDQYNIVLLKRHSEKIENQEQYEADSVIKDLDLTLVDTFDDLIKQLLANHLPKIKSPLAKAGKKLLKLACGV